jgi:mannitol/fructose-specific phosphotransferase system IIA component (Ntr-type)
VDQVRGVLGSLLSADAVLDVSPEAGKEAVIALLGRRACEIAGVLRPEPVLSALWERERILSTGIGLGVAVPHVRHPAVPREVMTVGRAKGGMPFDAIDAKPVHAVFTLLLPAGRQRRHVEILAAIATAMKDDARRASAFRAATAQEFVEALLGPR